MIVGIPPSTTVIESALTIIRASSFITASKLRTCISPLLCFVTSDCRAPKKIAKAAIAIAVNKTLSFDVSTFPAMALRLSPTDFN